MYDKRSRCVDDRIISLSQPHLRSIVRGKAVRDVEFGAKISVSLVDGFSFVDRISWDNYNESQDLIAQVESYRKRFGFYPESVHADKIYRTRANRSWCKSRDIRLSGPPLGGPRKATESNAEEVKREKRQHRQDEIDRIAIEGKFGQGKRRFGLGRVMAKLACTSEAVIMIWFMVMNLEKILSGCLYFYFIYDINSGLLGESVSWVHIIRSYIHVWTSQLDLRKYRDAIVCVWNAPMINYSASSMLVPPSPEPTQQELAFR